MIRAVPHQQFGECARRLRRAQIAQRLSGFLASQKLRRGRVGGLYGWRGEGLHSFANGLGLPLRLRRNNSQHDLWFHANRVLPDVGEVSGHEPSRLVVEPDIHR